MRIDLRKTNDRSCDKQTFLLHPKFNLKSPIAEGAKAHIVHLHSLNLVSMFDALFSVIFT
jgi:hypothetical protein